MFQGRGYGDSYCQPTGKCQLRSTSDLRDVKSTVDKRTLVERSKRAGRGSKVYYSGFMVDDYGRVQDVDHEDSVRMIAWVQSMHFPGRKSSILFLFPPI